jgi:hypothetical protein
MGLRRGLCFALGRAWEGEFLALAGEVLGGSASCEGGGDDDSKMLLRRAIQEIERRMTGAEAFSGRTSKYL